MPAASFELECDRLSRVVDSVQFERMRWARTEAPMLEHLVELLRATVEERPDLELGEEGSAANTKRFVLKVHGIRVVAISVALGAGRAILAAGAIERSAYRLTDAEPESAPFADVDAAWMEAAIERLFGRVAG
jgi:hypothetical protein